MPKRGVLDEVAAFLKLDVPDTLPAARAVGVREFAGAVRGEIAVTEAVDRVERATRRAAKRQRTWFRTRAAGWTTLPPDAAARVLDGVRATASLR